MPSAINTATKTPGQFSFGRRNDKLAVSRQSRHRKTPRSVTYQTGRMFSSESDFPDFVVAYNHLRLRRPHNPGSGRSQLCVVRLDRCGETCALANWSSPKNRRNKISCQLKGDTIPTDVLNRPPPRVLKSASCAKNATKLAGKIFLARCRFFSRLLAVHRRGYSDTAWPTVSPNPSQISDSFLTLSLLRGGLVSDIHVLSRAPRYESGVVLTPAPGRKST